MTPLEISATLQEIIGWLNIYDLHKAAQVCRIWQKVVQSLLNNFTRKVSISNNGDKDMTKLFYRKDDQIVCDGNMTDPNAQLILQKPIVGIFHGAEWLPRLGLRVGTSDLYLAISGRDCGHWMVDGRNDGYDLLTEKHLGAVYRYDPGVYQSLIDITDMSIFQHVRYMTFWHNDVSFHWFEGRVRAVRFDQTTRTFVSSPHAELCEFFVTFVMPFLRSELSRRGLSVDHLRIAKNIHVTEY